jgi:hypothetical protein
VTRRGLKPSDIRTLSPRTLQPVEGFEAIRDHVIGTTNNLDQTVMVYTAQTGLSNSVVFRELGNDPVNIGIVGLCGCTALVVVNEQAVYFAHYYENLSFRANPGDPPANFQANVIDFLKDGLPSYDSLAAHAGIFNNPSTTAYILTPARGNTLLYDDEIRALGDTIVEILPNMKNDIVEFPYSPVNMGTGTGDTLMADTILGRALFEYDPNPDPNGVQHRQLRIFFQSKPILSSL